MAKNKITDLRDHLFETIEMLKDPDEDNKMTIEKAKAIADIGQVIINSAKIEADLIKSIGSQTTYVPSDFFGDLKQLNP